MYGMNTQRAPGRREWLGHGLGWLGGIAAGFSFLAANGRAQSPPQTLPRRNDGGPDDDPNSRLKPDPKLILEANDKDIKKRVEKLFQLATELKAEVDKTNSSQVLSLAMVKKAEEIEKLAKEISSRAKG